MKNKIENIIIEISNWDINSVKDLISELESIAECLEEENER